MFGSMPSKQLSTCPVLLSGLSGWVVNETLHCYSYLKITWLMLSRAHQSLLEFVSCRCHTGCNTGFCSSYDSGLRFTDVFGCFNCNNKDHEDSNTLESQEVTIVSHILLWGLPACSKMGVKQLPLKSAIWLCHHGLRA